jgi:hypothetical protein
VRNRVSSERLVLTGVMPAMLTTGTMAMAIVGKLQRRQDSTVSCTTAPSKQETHVLGDVGSGRVVSISQSTIGYACERFEEL